MRRNEDDEIQVLGTAPKNNGCKVVWRLIAIVTGVLLIVLCVIYLSINKKEGEATFFYLLLFFSERYTKVCIFFLGPDLEGAVILGTITTYLLGELPSETVVTCSLSCNAE